MLRIGITGGLGSGKSTVAEMFRSRGCPVLDADRIAHQLLQGSCKAAVVARFGAGILASDGSVEPARLAALVFAPGAEQELRALEAILHPAIRAVEAVEFERMAREGVLLAGLDAALLAETGRLRDFDRALVVVCDPEIRLQRYLARTGTTRAEAEGRMRRQLPDAAKVKMAHVVIDNSGSREDTGTQVEQVVEQWKNEVMGRAEHV